MNWIQRLLTRLGTPAGASVSADIAAIEDLVDDLETRVGTNVDAAGTATLFARLRQIVDTYLADATVGLAALEALVDDLETRLGTPAAGTVAGDVESIETKVGTNVDAAGTTTLFARLKQIVDTYLGDATIGLAAIEALVDDLETRLGTPAAGTVAGDVESIEALVDTAETTGPFSYLDAGGEQDVVEDTATTRRHIWLEFSNRNMTQTGTFRLYRKVDGANYDLWDTAPVLVAAGNDRAFDYEFTTNQEWKLTYEEDVDEGAARAIPYNVITQVKE